MDDSNNVLVVEDDLALSDLVGGLLDQAGYTPVTIADHALIGAAVDRWQPRLVILDGEVRTTGEARSWDDAVAIRREHPSLPVLMFSADGDLLAEARAGTSERSRAASFDAIVGKPFVVEEFLATVKSVMERPPHLAAEWPATDLLTTVVHELRAPLTVMKGQAQLARRFIGQDPERERKAIDSALAQMDRMSRTIGELLTESRLSSNALGLDVVALDLAEAVAGAMTRHQYGATSRVSLERPLLPVVVQADPARIAEILDNLLDNAIKYSPEDAPILMSLTVQANEAQLRIADRGVGVPVAERSMLFTPFYRTSRTACSYGTGLGLHISQRLARRYGGRLWLEASSENGSVFALALPIAN